MSIPHCAGCHRSSHEGIYKLVQNRSIFTCGPEKLPWPSTDGSTGTLVAPASAASEVCWRRMPTAGAARLASNGCVLGTVVWAVMLPPCSRTAARQRGYALNRGLPRPWTQLQQDRSKQTRGLPLLLSACPCPPATLAGWICGIAEVSALPAPAATRVVADRRPQRTRCLRGLH